MLLTSSNRDSAKSFLERFWIVTLLLVPLLFLLPQSLDFFGLNDFMLRPYLQFLLTTTIFYSSFIFFQHAKHEIRHKQYGMMTLVSIAIGSGYLFSAVSTFLPALSTEFYFEISTLIWVLLFGHYLEAKSSSAAGNALDQVSKLLPDQAHLLINGEEKDVPLTKLKKGDIVLVKPGESVPADGKIIKGEANFSEAIVTGESKLIVKKKKDKVIAGSICLDGAVEIKLDRVGERSTVGQIKKLIEEAKQTKPKAQNLADKAAGRLTFISLIVSLITLVVWTLLFGRPFIFSLTLAISVLVVTCPHALGLAIPTVTTIATSLAVKNGLFIKDLTKLEEAKDVDYIVFDKTGTLTKGELGVTKVKGFKSSKKDIIKIAGSIEKKSSHLIGKSITDYAQDKGVNLKEIEQFKNIAGKGVAGKIDNQKYFIGNIKLMHEIKVWNQELEKFYQQELLQSETLVFVASANQVLGMIILADRINVESKHAIKTLHQKGIKTAMLTGDNKEVAQKVANKLEIDTFFADVLPENKYKYISQLQQKGNKVMMVGDGVNDAPALIQADVGVAIGAGTDVALESADIVLTRNNPSDVFKLVVLSKKVYRKMIENLIWALGYNVIAIPAAAGVFIPLGFRLRPEIAALIMSLSSVIVVVNALSLKKIKI